MLMYATAQNGHFRVRYGILVGRGFMSGRVLSVSWLVYAARADVEVGMKMSCAGNTFISAGRTRMRGSEGSVFLAVIVLLGLVGAAGAAAQEAQDRRPTVILVVLSQSVIGDALNALIRDAITLQLAHSLRVLLPDTLEASLGASAPTVDPDFRFVVDVTRNDTLIQLDVHWLNRGETAPAAEQEWSAPLDLSFDDGIAALVAGILDGQKDVIASATPPPLAPDPPPLVVTDPVNTGIVAPEKAPPAIPPFAASVSSAPFIATFTAGNYFPVGLFVSAGSGIPLSCPGGPRGPRARDGLQRLSWPWRVHGGGHHPAAGGRASPVRHADRHHRGFRHPRGCRPGVFRADPQRPGNALEDPCRTSPGAWSCHSRCSAAWVFPLMGHMPATWIRRLPSRASHRRSPFS